MARSTIRMSAAELKDKFNLNQTIENILSVIEQDREKEIVSRRFGLEDRRQTLEQIGDHLGITRERVRQLEKAIVIRLKIAAEDKLIKELPVAEKFIIRNLAETGRIARTTDLTYRLVGEKATAIDESKVAFIAEISNQLTLIDENDNYYEAVSIAEYGDKKSIKQRVDEIVKIIKEAKKPLSLDDLDSSLSYEHPNHINALALVSKKLATLNGHWGLVKWPEVNPKNIKDKIYVVLSQVKKPMHFSEINNAIKNSDFKRKNVTKQAIHNELIKDSRFVLIGRGIYALEEWGYERGTVSEIIAEILKKNKEPMYRDEIVKQVLRKRKVKETTVLLNLQSRPEFKRIAKATYTYSPAEQQTVN